MLQNTKYHTNSMNNEHDSGNGGCIAFEQNNTGMPLGLERNKMNILCFWTIRPYGR